MQDLRIRIGRTLSMFVAVYLIQALSFSTVYAAVISGDFSLRNSVPRPQEISLKTLGVRENIFGRQRPILPALARVRRRVWKRSCR